MHMFKNISISTLFLSKIFLAISMLSKYLIFFCREIAYNQIRTDYTATRMLGYLYRTSNPRAEDVVDEMLAILSDRNAIIQKKELEHAQATINKVYREGL